MTPLRRFRRWIIEGVECEMPSTAPLGTPVPRTLAEVPADWTRRPQSPPNPPRPGGR